MPHSTLLSAFPCTLYRLHHDAFGPSLTQGDGTHARALTCNTHPAWIRGVTGSEVGKSRTVMQQGLKTCIPTSRRSVDCSRMVLGTAQPSPCQRKAYVVLFQSYKGLNSPSTTAERSHALVQARPPCSNPTLHALTQSSMPTSERDCHPTDYDHSPLPESPLPSASTPTPPPPPNSAPTR